jgi:Ni/Fe-hydrogenase subunit HybB-like protein
MSDEATTTGKSYLTPFNMIAGIIVIVGLIVTVLRFTKGLGAVTNLSDYNPWGIPITIPGESGSVLICWSVLLWQPGGSSPPPPFIFSA